MVKIAVEDLSYHRNGVGGNGFHVVLFREMSTDDESPMVGIVFEERGSVAILDRQRLSRGVIDSMLNAWRGDMYESSLRHAIATKEGFEPSVPPHEPDEDEDGPWHVPPPAKQDQCARESCQHAFSRHFVTYDLANHGCLQCLTNNDTRSCVGFLIFYRGTA